VNEMHIQKVEDGCKKSVHFLCIRMLISFPDPELSRNCALIMWD